MKTNIKQTLRTLLTVSSAAVILASCASSPRTPDGAVAARMRLTQLQQNSELASRAPEEIRAADLAVRAAELPHRDRAITTHRVLIADQKIDIADAWAHSRLYEDQRQALAARSDSIRLDARTREADLARSDARSARSDANFARDAASEARDDASSAQRAADQARLQADDARDQTRLARTDANTERSAADAARGQTTIALDQADAARLDAERARTQAERARQDTASAQSQNEELRRQIAELNARPTDRGLVVTLGDVLFETGRSDLKGGSLTVLDRLVTFLDQYPERTVIIEGHTDSVGTESSNQLLSQNRADSVMSYLTSRGVANSRLSASGKGELIPVSNNDSATGRQQNRRVEVIISNNP
jgi:outer membrane protein OmpA-like peptidoglycan-associated protein